MNSKDYKILINACIGGAYSEQLFIVFTTSNKKFIAMYISPDDDLVGKSVVDIQEYDTLHDMITKYSWELWMLMDVENKKLLHLIDKFMTTQKITKVETEIVL